MDRRDFLKIGGLTIGAGLLSTYAAEGRYRGLERRPLGRTGHQRSVVTLGGVVVMKEAQEDADRLVAEALDAGVNGVDVAPSYGDAELKLGHALRGKRDQVFIGCKTTKRDKAGAAEELRNSLRRLETDHVDMYLFHGLDKPEELTQVMGPGGATEAFQEGQKQGLLRFIGMTSHRPSTLLSALQQYDFAAVVFPYNFILDHYGFARELLVETNRRGTGVLAIKPIAERAWEPKEPRTCPKCWYKPFTENEDIYLAMRWVLSRPITSAIPSGDTRLFRRALKAAQHYKPLTEAELGKLSQRAAVLKPLFEVA
jgi:predicted aldo/keto reductase-like oxidoreductase